MPELSFDYGLIMTAMKSHRQWSLTVQLPSAPFGIQYNTGRVLQGVAPGSPAERAGRRTGDLVVEVRGQPCWNAHSVNMAGVTQVVACMLMRTAAYVGVPGPKGARASGGPDPNAHDSGHTDSDSTKRSDTWSF